MFTCYSHTKPVKITIICDIRPMLSNLSSKAEGHSVMFTLARLFCNNCVDTLYYNSLKQLRLHLTRNSLHYCIPIGT